VSCVRSVQHTGKFAFLEVVRGQLQGHASEIFLKGYGFVTTELGHTHRDAIEKSLGGLSRFLGLPVELYGQYMYGIADANEAKIHRAICSCMVTAVLLGYGQAQFDQQPGQAVLPKVPRSWASYLAYLTSSDLASVIDMIEPGEFRGGLQSNVLPVVAALERLLASEGEEYYLLPRLGGFSWNYRRLEMSVSVPHNATGKRSMDLHCYLLPSYVERTALEQSEGRGASLIAVSLRPDLREWALSRERLASVWLDTTSAQTRRDADIIDRAVAILKQGLVLLAGTARPAALLTYNVAEEFPLHQASVGPAYLVERRSVRRLLESFERQTGIHLWCSTRRSGKTTSCLNLSTATGTSVLVRQCMQPTDEDRGTGVFNRLFTEALSSGKPLPATFMRDAIAECADEGIDRERKIVFLLDEYESLFERVRHAVRRDPELRYTVGHPLMNQMVAFSRDNLLVLVGQRPDAHYILMDQNQLSAYVQQDGFPLFEHESGSLDTEFAELLRRVLTSQMAFDPGFANAVFLETSGHPYLTVEVLVEFCQWLIDSQRPNAPVALSQGEFDEFARDRLCPDALRVSTGFTYFRNVVADYLSDDTRQQFPWLYAIHHALQRIAQESPVGLSVSQGRFGELVRPVTEPLGWEPEYLLRSAKMSNFLAQEDDNIRPTIPVMARLAMVTRPRVV
jgi:hypothetical protein